VNNVHELRYACLASVTFLLFFFIFIILVHELRYACLASIAFLLFLFLFCYTFLLFLLYFLILLVYDLCSYITMRS